jgi:hypothetical protein
MRAGFALSDITPHAGEHPEMMGFGPFIGRSALEVLQSLHVRASYLEDREGRAAVLLSFDLCGLGEDLADAIRREVAKAVGVSAGQVIAACTHTHSAPSVMPIIGWGEFDGKTARRLPGLAAQAAAEARAKARETVVEVGSTELDGFSRNRVYGGDGPRDIGLRTLSFRDRRDRRLVGLWAHYTCHPVLLCEQCRVISPDFCGVAMQALEAANEGAVCSFLQGYCGDINPVLAHMRQERSIVHLAHFGRRFRVAVEEAMGAARPVTGGRVSAVSEKLALPVSIQSEEVIAAFGASAQMRGDGWRKLAKLSVPALRAEASKLRHVRQPQRKAPAAALSVGGHTLVFHPFEMFTQIGLDIRKALGAKNTWVVGYTNGYEGYAPTIDRFSPPSGDYAAHGVPLMMGRNPYSPTLGDELVAGLADLGRRTRQSS